MAAVIWFFVQNASQNMVKAGIASGFRFLWRDSGIEVPFNITGYKPSDNIHALGAAVDRRRQHAAGVDRLDRGGDDRGLHDRGCCGSRTTGCSRPWKPPSTSSSVRNIPLLFFVLFWYFGVLAAAADAAREP